MKPEIVTEEDRFCAHCGADISHLPDGETLCFDCDLVVTDEIDDNLVEPESPDNGTPKTQGDPTP